MMIKKGDIQQYKENGRILLRKPDFIYVLPTLPLRKIISNYTICFPGQAMLSDNYTILPHGSATLVFTHTRHGWHSELFGPLTHSCVVGSQANQCDLLLIIEFQPAGLAAFTGLPQKECTDQVFAFETIHPTLNRKFLALAETAENLEMLIHQLDLQFFKSCQTVFPLALTQAVSQLIENPELSIDACSASVFYSQRHLNRIFETYIGMNPKTFLRLVRINKALRLLHNPQLTLTQIAVETGYYDSAHFIHDFKSVCQTPPGIVRKHMADFYNAIAKF